MVVHGLSQLAMHIQPVEHRGVNIRMMQMRLTNWNLILLSVVIDLITTLVVTKLSQFLIW